MFACSVVCVRVPEGRGRWDVLQCSVGTFTHEVETSRRLYPIGIYQRNHLNFDLFNALNHSGNYTYHLLVYYKHLCTPYVSNDSRNKQR
jgi:hypothetical protein